MFAGLVLSACTCGQNTCGPDNCFGCCTADGECVGGQVQNQCGANGNLCDVCVATQTCQLGRCISAGVGGGFVTGGGTATGGGGGSLGGGTATGGGTTTGGGTATGGGGGTATGGGGTTGGGTGARTVTGKATYDFVPSRYTQGQGGTLYFNQTTQKPIRNATIRVVENGSAVLATGVTGEDGSYALSFTPGSGTLQVQVLARSQTPAIQIEDNTANNATWAFGTTLNAGVSLLNVNATHGWTGSSYGANRRAAPFAILDTMYGASKAFMAVRTVNFPALKVNWSPNNAPQSGNPATGAIGTSHFSPNENEIYVLGLSGSDTDEFDTHVIVHEWGHYFEENLSRSDSPGGPHGNGDVLDPRIAFGEAWGTAVAAMVLPETMYTDSMWSNSQLGAWGYDAETPAQGDDPSPSVFSENSVLRVLFDLYDTPSDGAWDQTAFGLGTVYDVMTGPEVQTEAVTSIGSFVTGLKARPGANAAAINAVLAHWSIGAITDDFGTGDTNLAGMFTPATVPYNGGIGLLGGYASNTYQQNQYFVFTGPGRNVTVTAGNASYDVGVYVYRRGQYVAGADSTTSGNESCSLNAASGAKYVVVVTGYNGPTNMSSYQVNVTVQ